MSASVFAAGVAIVKSFYLVFVAGLFTAGCDLSEEPCVRVHVSPSGDDACEGTASHPVRTPSGARDALRRMRQSPAAVGVRAEVVFADGEYRISEPVRLDSCDGSNVTWRAANRGKAVFSGAIDLSWQRLGDAKVRSLLPPEARDKVLVADVPGKSPMPSFSGGSHLADGCKSEIPISLFSGTNRLFYARYPEGEFARTSSEGETNAVGQLTGFVGFGDAPLLAKLAKEPFAWAFGLWSHEWADCATPVVSVDVTGGRIKVEPKMAWRPKKNMPFYVFNAFFALNAPGKWVADLERRRVYLWPMEDVPEADVALSDGLMRIDHVSDFAIDGIVFEKTRLTALEANNSQRLSVMASTFRHTGSWAVRINGGSDCRIAGCDMYDLGEGGVYVEGGDMKTLAPSGHVVDNCHIHHYGRVRYNYRQGIALHGTGCWATHNLVHHSMHTGIYARGNDHYIGYNVVHDTCLFNDDAGAIYTWQYSWLKRGGMIEHNVVHHTGKPGRTFARTHGIYIDDYGSDVIVRRNIVNYANYGVVIAGGQDNYVYGNAFMNCATPLILASRFDWADSKKGRDSKLLKELETNMVTVTSALWRTHYPGIMKTLELAKDDPAIAHHAWRNTISNNVAFVSGDWGRWKWEVVGPSTVWTNNVILDEKPQFANFEHLDWNVQPGSPAYDIIKDCQFEKAGLYASNERATPPVKFSLDVSTADWQGFPKKEQ